MSPIPAKLYHISDEPGITQFIPRPNPRKPEEEPLVWAIDEEHLPNYLLPRECPRVTFYARGDSDPADIDRLLCGVSAGRVIAVEKCWLSRIRQERLYLYEFNSAAFTINDDIAGYHTSPEHVEPVSEREICDVLEELLQYDIELRVMPSLWKLREQVIHSTLNFSLIRMRNAQPPVEGYQAFCLLP